MYPYKLVGKGKKARLVWADCQYLRYNERERRFEFSYDKSFRELEALAFDNWTEGTPQETIEILRLLRLLVKRTVK